MAVRPFCPTCDRFVSSHVPHVDRDLGRECITSPVLVVIVPLEEAEAATWAGRPIYRVPRDDP